MLNIEEIKARTEKASRGPWNWQQNRHPNCDGTPWGWIKGPAGNMCWSGAQSRVDADFIAHAREDIPVLLAEIERLQEENVALRDTIDKMMAQNKRIISSNAAKDQQIVTLKRALELIVASLRENNFNCPDADYFIHQAQEQEAKS